MTVPLLFWDVDTQVDFILPGGKLYVSGAEQIIPNLARLTQYALQHRIPIVASMDAHHPDDVEFAQYPPHCVAGTPGQKKIPETLAANHLVLPNQPVSLPDDLSGYQQVIVEKQTLDVFRNPNLDELLAQFGQRNVVLYGVVSEICVVLAARGLLDHGFRVRVVTDAIRALNAEQASVCLTDVIRRGATLTTTVEILAAEAASLSSSRFR